MPKYRNTGIELSKGSPARQVQEGYMYTGGEVMYQHMPDGNEGIVPARVE